MSLRLALKTSVSAVIEIVDESLDVSSPTPGPADPLIIEMRGDVFTGDDDAEAFVVISDSLDHVVIVDDDRPDPRLRTVAENKNVASDCSESSG